MSSASVPAASAGPNPAEKLLLLSVGFMMSSALHGVTVLGIPDMLQSGPKNVADLAVATGSNEDGLYRVMRALASEGVFSEGPQRTFSQTAMSEMLCAAAPNSSRQMVLWVGDPFHLEVFHEMSHAIRTGETVCEKTHGLPCFDYLGKDKRIGDIFNDAMTGFSKGIIAATLDAYDFSWLAGKTLVDVAGGHGMVLTEILKKYPTARGVLFDLEHVVSGAQPRIASLGLQDRCTMAHGDFFQAVPEGDAYVLKHIIHDWEDAKAAAILRNIHQAARPSAKVILLECILAPGNDPGFIKWLDLEMLLLPGGRERSEEEYRNLLANAGFKLTRVVPTKSPVCVIEAVRQN